MTTRHLNEKQQVDDPNSVELYEDLEVTDTEINTESYSEDGQDNDDETPK